MRDFKRGTPAFGVLMGGLFVLCGALVLWIGFWRTLLLAALFAVGYFVGAVTNKKELVKEAVDRVAPRKENQVINFRREVEKDQAAVRTDDSLEQEDAAPVSEPEDQDGTEE